jgi:three-Cys-motif partner protein
MHHYLKPENDGLKMRESGPYVIEKLYILSRYINMFENGMRVKPWHRRHYIDLFSGLGKCIVKRIGCVYLGSPLIALTVAHPFTDYFFVDMDPENIDVLRQRCSISPIFDRITFKQADSNIFAREIVEKIKKRDSNKPRRSWSSLNFGKCQ